MSTKYQRIEELFRKISETRYERENGDHINTDGEDDTNVELDTLESFYHQELDELVGGTNVYFDIFPVDRTRFPIEEALFSEEYDQINGQQLI